MYVVLGFKLRALHLKPLHQPFSVIFFFLHRVSLIIFPGWLWTAVLLISASWVAKITDMSHQHWALSSWHSLPCLLCFSYTGLLVCTYLRTCFILFIYFIVFTFTHMCIHCLGHLPSPPPPPPPTSRHNLFCPLLLRYCWRENISNNMKDIAFLLVWDKNSYTERFLALLPCTCVLQPTLIHLYQTSLLLPSPLPIGPILTVIISDRASLIVWHRAYPVILSYLPALPFL
jgi:hypothetical protein